MSNSIDLIFSELSKIHEYYAREHGATNLGSTPGKYGTVWWMCKRDDSHLYVVGDDGVPNLCRRDEWEALTKFAPPWPWSEDGLEMVIPS